MVTHKLIGEFLKSLSYDEPRTTREISQKLERCDGNVRRTLGVMVEIGIVVREDCEREGKTYKGWRRARLS